MECTRFSMCFSVHLKTMTCGLSMLLAFHLCNTTKFTVVKFKVDSPSSPDLYNRTLQASNMPESWFYKKSYPKHMIVWNYLIHKPCGRVRVTLFFFKCQYQVSYLLDQSPKQKLKFNSVSEPSTKFRVFR